MEIKGEDFIFPNILCFMMHYFIQLRPSDDISFRDVLSTPIIIIVLFS